MKNLRSCLVVLVFITSFVFSAIFHPVQAIETTTISSPEGLNAIRNNLSGHYQLTADIDMSSFGNWVPIGTWGAGFSGSLDGNGFTIRNISISNTQSEYIGFFGEISSDGVVQNLQISNAAVTGFNYSGILTGVNKGLIEKVATQGVVSGMNSVGGIAGYNEGIINNSYTKSSVAGNTNFGGLVGWNNGTVSTSYSASTVSNSSITNYIQFDGTNDYILIPHNEVYETESFTLEAWFNWDLSGSDAVSFIVGKGFENFEIHTGGGSGINGIRFIPIHRVDDAGGAAAAYNDVYNILQPGWNHVASTWDYEKREVRVFLNGIPQNIYHNGVNQGTVATIPVADGHVALADNTQDLFIGARNNWTAGYPTAAPSYYFNGNISDVRFWNKARTAAEIAADKDVHLSGTEEGLIGYWKLDEASGIYVIDSSPTNNTGVIKGGATRKTITGLRGGLVGRNNGTISNSYYDSDKATIPDNGFGTDLTTTNMKIASSFGGWDFINTWHILEGETYPSLFPFSVVIEKDPSQPDPASTSSINFIATFDEPIIKTSFSTDDIVLAGIAGADQVEITEIAPNNGTNFELSVSGMTGDGTVSLSIPEGKVIDVLSNFNLSGTSSEIAYEADTTPPTVSISSSNSSPTNSPLIPISITFSEDVIGFTVADIQVTNGTLENFSGSGKDYTVELIPSSNGTVSLNIPADAAEDKAGNGNIEASTFNINYDSTPPKVTISSMGKSPTNIEPIIIEILFDENVIGFTEDDIQVTNGSVIFFTFSYKSYYVGISPIIDGQITVVIPEDVVTDAAGNSNFSSNQITIEYDTTSPGVTINQSSLQYDPTNSQPIHFSAIFSEPIRTYSFSPNDLSIIGVSGTPTINITEIAPNDGTTFDIAVSGLTQSDTVSMSLLENKVNDLAGNNNLQSTSTDNSVVYDITNPTVNISTSVSDFTNVSPIPISIEFNEPVVGFDLADIAVINGTATNLSSTDDSYSVDITPSEEGLIKVEIPENIALDLAGNPNIAAIALEITYDSTMPIVSIEQAATQNDPTNTGPLLFTVIFSKPINIETFTIDDFILQAPTGSTISSITELEPHDDTTFEVTIDGMTEDGLVTLTMSEGKVQDLAGNNNTASTSEDNSVEYDISSPSVTISTSVPSQTNISLIPISIEFSEDVVGFGLEDISVSNGTASKLSGEGDSYTVDITPIGDGEISIQIPSGISTDIAGNESSESNQFTIEFDSTHPTVTVEQSTLQVDPTNTSPILFTATFNEPIDPDSFTNEDVLVEGNAGASGVTIYQLSPTSFNIAIGNIPQCGTIQVSILAETVKDMAGNPNSASTSIDNMVTYDVEELIVTIERSDSQPDHTNNLPIKFTVHFSKPINLETFTTDDFNPQAPVGATITSITELETLDDTTFEVIIDGMTEDGLVTLTIPEGKVQDLAGNDNTASTSEDNSVLYDTKSPLIDKIDIEKFYEGNPPDQISITFAEAMFNPEGDSDPDDVTNPANYLLVEWGENASFDTTTCKDGWQVDDKLIKISSATYDKETFATTLKLPYKLTEGSYRLFICGSATLYDAAKNPFNNGFDSIHNFIVLSQPTEEEQEEENTNSSQSPTLLPETGFPIGQTTLLAKQQASQKYNSTDIKLEIPGVIGRTSISGVPLVNGYWDVSWLGNQVGYLYGSAYPTWQGNTVLTGHVWNANNTPGVFFDLKTLKYGDLIRIYAYGMVYTYEVRSSHLISETNLKAAFQSEEYDWITLLTCEGYEPNDKTYSSRRIVRAVLASVE